MYATRYTPRPGQQDSDAASLETRNAGLRSSERRTSICCSAPTEGNTTATQLHWKQAPGPRDATQYNAQIGKGRREFTGFTSSIDGTEVGINTLKYHRRGSYHFDLQ